MAHAEDVVPDPTTERPDDLPVVLVVIDGEPGEMLVDSGSQVNGISQEFYDKIARGNNSQLQIIPDELCKIRALGHTFLSKSAVEAVLTVGKNTRVKVKFKVLPGLPYAAVLGTPGIREHGFWMTSDLRQLITPGDFLPCLTQPQLASVRKCLKQRKMVRWQVKCVEDVVVGPREEMTIEVPIKSCDNLGTVMFTPDTAFTPITGMLLAHSVHKIKDNVATILVLNCAFLPVRMRRGTILGSFEPTDEKYVEGANKPMHHPTRKRGDIFVPISPKTRRRLREYVRNVRSKERQVNNILRRQTQGGQASDEADISSQSSEEEGEGLDPEKFPPIEDVEPDPERQPPRLDPMSLQKAMEGCKLNKHWRRRLVCLLWEFMDVFDGANLGNCDICPHEIDTGDVAPISQRPFPTSPRLRAVIETQVQDMLEKGVIRISDSPWSAGLVVVTKADGTPRVCVDFRMLNSVTRGPDRFPLPKIDDMINKLRNANFFTCLDLLSGFWQQAMDPKSI
ncbi:MAG: hypothetical protein GY696_29540 [Gammaproteobacteria bacterium]|nr:hypothetical protein [Gammaproteobacteria bacterium]